MMTAYSTLGRVLSSYRQGADNYILKPFESLADVEEKVKKPIQKGIKKTLLFLSFALIFLGCAKKQIELSEPVFVSIESKEIKFADLGFLNEGNGKKTLEVYGAGVALFSIDSKDRVCNAVGCKGVQEFVQKHISQALDSSVVRAILTKSPLDIESNVSNDAEGFLQTAKTGSYDIFYRVTKRETIFEERLNGFRFIIRSLD